MQSCGAHSNRCIYKTIPYPNLREQCGKGQKISKSQWIMKIALRSYLQVTAETKPMKSHKHDRTKIHKARGHKWLHQSGSGQCLKCQYHTNSTSQPRNAACSERSFSWGGEYQLLGQFSIVSPKKHIQFTLYKLNKL